MNKPHTHCHFCGSKYEADVWPRACGACNGRTWRNPTPVALALVYVKSERGVLVVRRDIEPRKGFFACPGGFIDFGETYQEGAVRELKEETGLVLPASDARFYAIETSSNRNIQIFCTLPDIDSMPSLVTNTEVSELGIVHRDEREIAQLAFPTHQEVIRKFFGSRL